MSVRPETRFHTASRTRCCLAVPVPAHPPRVRNRPILQQTTPAGFRRVSRSYLEGRSPFELGIPGRFLGLFDPFVPDQSHGAACESSAGRTRRLRLEIVFTLMQNHGAADNRVGAVSNRQHFSNEAQATRPIPTDLDIAEIASMTDGIRGTTVGIVGGVEMPTGTDTSIG